MTEQSRVPVDAVVRFDGLVDHTVACIAVQGVFPTIAEARSEAARLNDLNGSKDVEYAVRVSRYNPDGRELGADADPDASPSPN